MNTLELKTFLYDDSTEIKIPMCPLNDIVEAMDEFGFPRDQYELDTNGWQVDFWLDFTKAGYPYKVTIAGSLFYGSFTASKELL